MISHIHRILTSLGIAASSLLVCCSTPVDHGSMYYEAHYTLHVVTADGISHWILADDSAYIHPVLTDSLVIFGGGRDVWSLWKVKYDGSNFTQLHPGVPWVDRSLSPSGDKILLASSFRENSAYLNELYLLDPHGTNLVKLGPQPGSYDWPRISADLDEIVFTRDGGIALIQSDGSGFQYIRTKTASTKCTFALYVDDTHILFFEEGNAWPPTAIWLHDRVTGEESLVGSCVSEFPPYGRKVVGPNLILADNGRIKIYNLFTSEARDVGKGSSAFFSSDGSKIVSSDAKTIFILNSDGTDKHIIFTETDPEKSIINPQFSPDDKLVVFQESWTSQ